MDTLLILRDTITVNAFKVIDSFPVCVKEAETNWEDTQIALYICITIVVVWGIVAFSFYKWQKAKYNFLFSANNQENLHEIEKANLEASRIADKDAKDRAEKEEKRKAEKVEKEKIKSDYQVAGEFFKQVCDATKDKDGKFDNAALETLITFFREEWRNSKGSENKNASSNDKS